MPKLSNGQLCDRFSERDLVVMYLCRCYGQNTCTIKACEINRLLQFVTMTDDEFRADIRGRDEWGVRMFVEGYVLGLTNA